MSFPRALFCVTLTSPCLSDLSVWRVVVRLSAKLNTCTKIVVDGYRAAYEIKLKTEIEAALHAVSAYVTPPAHTASSRMLTSGGPPAPVKASVPGGLPELFDFYKMQNNGHPVRATGIFISLRCHLPSGAAFSHVRTFVCLDRCRRTAALPWRS